MPEGGENGKEDHKDEGPDCAVRRTNSNTEQSNEADLCQIETHKDLLERSWIHESKRVLGRTIYKQKLISIRKVEQVKPDAGKSKNKWCYARIGEG